MITDKNLLTGLGHLDAKHSDAVVRFLAAYIILSQILFLRLLAVARPELMPQVKVGAITPPILRKVFKKILEINYRPIYELDVLDAIPKNYLRDTYDLIWALEIEKIRYEIPGRLFHALMPPFIRKILAAFYTRPQAAEILAQLSIDSATATVLDPACGSGTILTSAYRQKARLWKERRLTGDPHTRFCEEDIFGADIMPFAIHLTGANLAAMEPGITIHKTQIVEGDSLHLSPGFSTRSGVQGDLFPEVTRARKSSGKEYQLEMEKVDALLMNPPFTKVERRIQDYVDMEKFGDVCGHHVGLWGHFLLLANEFLKNEGICGAVIPINLLRGTESQKVRDFVFREWTPLYILKPTMNYGFSEWSEYRDILFIAAKKRPPAGHRVRFALVKQDLTKLNEESIESISRRVRKIGHLRAPDLDIESFPIEELQKRRVNMMWFCGVGDYARRDAIISFVDRFSGVLKSFPPGYFREGFRPVPKGVSQFLFLTREIYSSRTEEAFLRFDSESAHSIKAWSPMGVKYDIPLEDVVRSLRTCVGLETMDITDQEDYIAHRPYKEIERVKRASGFNPPTEHFDWRAFWRTTQASLTEVQTNLVVVHRINPFSPNTSLASFYSANTFSPSNQPLVVTELDQRRAKAVCVLLNSGIFFGQFFLLKEESTGRYINLRAYDLREMPLYPEDDAVVGRLADVFDQYAKRKFLSLREQFDENFDSHYRAYIDKHHGEQQGSLFADLPIEPNELRVNFDLAICQAVGVGVSADDLRKLYGSIVHEMIAIRALTAD